MYLLDTMVVSEPTKARPDRRVEDWIQTKAPEDVFVSVLSLGEVLFGIRRLPYGSRRTRLAVWYRDALDPFYAERALPVDRVVADVWAGIRAQQKNTIPSIDGLIAATALSHGLTVVTRNVRHFSALNVPVLNPWLA